MRAGFLGRTRATENTCDGGHVETEDTCQRDTSDASGQQWANAGREVATPFFSFLYLLGNCVCLVWRPRPLK